jgi:hypothetical protein
MSIPIANSFQWQVLDTFTIHAFADSMGLTFPAQHPLDITRSAISVPIFDPDERSPASFGLHHGL